MKRLGKLNESDAQGQLLLSALLLDLAKGEDHALTFQLGSSIVTLGRHILPAPAGASRGPEHRLCDDTEEGDASIVVTVTSLAFVLLEGNGVGGRHVLSFLPSLAEHFICWQQQDGFAVLFQVRRIAWLSRVMHEVRLSMALLRSSTFGAASSSSTVGRLSTASRVAQCPV